ncbi:hypothetical protein ACFE04_010287 [Oxalis oulophora]
MPQRKRTVKKRNVNTIATTRPSSERPSFMPAGFSASPIPIPTRLISPTPSVQLSSRHLFPKVLHKQIPSTEQDAGDEDSDEDDDVSDEEHVDVSDEDSPPNSPNSTNNLKDNSHTPSEHGSRIEEASKQPKNFITIGDDLKKSAGKLLKMVGMKLVISLPDDLLEILMTIEIV